MWETNRILCYFAGVLIAQQAAAHNLNYRALLPRAAEADTISTSTTPASISPAAVSETQDSGSQVARARYARDTTSIVDPLDLGPWEISRLASIASQKLVSATAADTANSFSYSVALSPTPHLTSVPVSPPSATPAFSYSVDLTPTPHLTTVSAAENDRPTTFDLKSFSSSLSEFSKTAGASATATATVLVPSFSGLSVTLIPSTLTIRPSATSRSSTPSSSSTRSSSTSSASSRSSTSSRTSSSSSSTSTSPSSTFGRSGASSTSTALPTSADTRLSDGAIAGIVIGSVAALVVLLAILAICLRRRSARKQRPASARVYPEEAYLYDPPMSPNAPGGAAALAGRGGLRQPGMVQLPRTTATATGPLSNHPIPNSSLGGIRPGGPVAPGTAHAPQAPTERDALMGGMLGAGAVSAAAAAATGRNGRRRRSYSGGPRGMQRQMEGRVFGSVPEEDEDSAGEDLGTYRPNAELPQHDDSDTPEHGHGNPFADPHSQAQAAGGAAHQDWPLRDSQLSGSDYSRDSGGVRSSMALTPGMGFIPVPEEESSGDVGAQHANGNGYSHMNGSADDTLHMLPNGSPPKLRRVRNSFSFDRGTVEQI